MKLKIKLTIIIKKKKSMNYMKVFDASAHLALAQEELGYFMGC